MNKKVVILLLICSALVVLTACDSTSSTDVADDLIDNTQLQDASQGRVDQAADVALRADLMSIQTMLETYAAEAGTYPISARVQLNGSTDPLSIALGSTMQQVSLSRGAMYYESDGMTYKLSAELSDGSMYELTSY